MVADSSKKANRKVVDKELWYKTAGIALLIFVAYMIVADIKIYQKKKKLMVQIEQYKARIEEIKKSNKDLENEIANADNIDYLEKIGYEQFNQTRPGETEYMFINMPEKIDEAQEKKNFWNSFTASFSNAFNWLKSRF